MYMYLKIVQLQKLIRVDIIVPIENTATISLLDRILVVQEVVAVLLDLELIILNLLDQILQVLTKATVVLQEVIADTKAEVVLQEVEHTIVEVAEVVVLKVITEVLLQEVIAAIKVAVLQEAEVALQ